MYTRISKIKKKMYKFAVKFTKDELSHHDVMLLWFCMGKENKGNKKSCMYKYLGRSKPAKCFNEFKAKSEKQTYPSL